MQIKLEKNIGQTACRTSAFIGGGKWRVLAWQLLLVLLMFFASAGREAQSVSAGIHGDFYDRSEFAINETPTVSGLCTPDTLETRTTAGWEILEGSSKLDSGYYDKDTMTAYPNWDVPFQAKTELGKFAGPGDKLALRVYCTEWSLGLSATTKPFSILPLKGSYTASLDPNNYLVVEGTVGNGANEVRVHLLDEHGAVIQVLKETGLTDYFSMGIPLAPGKHKLKVYAFYGNYSVSLGETTVHSKPTVTLHDIYPTVTNKNRIRLNGRATSSAGIIKGWFDRVRDGNLSDMEDGPITLPSPGQETAALTKMVTVKNDGTHQFRVWAEAKDGQSLYSEPKTVLLDRKAPNIKDVRLSIKGSTVEKFTQIWVKANDLNLSGEPGSGIQRVMVRVKQGTVVTEWEDMNDSGNGLYAIGIPFDALSEGAFTIEAYAEDKATNETYYEPATLYYKAALPTASITIPDSPTTESKITIKGKAHSDVGLQAIFLIWWKDGEPATKQKVALDFSAGNDADISHALTLPNDGKYLFVLSVESKDRQPAVLSTMEVVVRDTIAPTVTIQSPELDSIHEKELKLEFTVKDAGSGVNDIQIRLGPDGAPWKKGIAINATGKYSYVLPLDGADAGNLRVTIWANDKAGNERREYGAYVKQVQAADALDATLTFLNTDGSAADAEFYADQQRLLRVSVMPKTALTGLDIAYTLPAGLSQRGTPVLSAGPSALPQDMPAQLKNWSGGGNLITGVDLAQDETLIVDIPVEIDRGVAVPNPKLGGPEQMTYFDVKGSNFTDAARAQTQWSMQWKQEPADVQQPISKIFDLSAPPDIQIFDAQSGGYDTADLTKWNRNTLHCTSGNATCETEAGATAVKLPFIDASGQTVTLKLIGQRHLTSENGGALPNTPLQNTDNIGADAEARFSLRLPQEELAKLPKGGMWQADLNLALQDHSGKVLANFSSAIKLDVGDTTGMALTPPQIALLPGSHQDRDHSGGYSAGDELTYRISYTAARDLTDVQLDYALPPGLEKAGPAPTFAGNSDVKPNGELSADWKQALLKHGVQMKKGNTLIIDVPLRIQSDKEVQIVSQVFVGVKGYAKMPSTETILQVQRRFSVAQALTLTLDMIDPATVAQQAPFVYRIVLTAQKQNVEAASLRYRLPGGLYPAGSPSLVVDATKQVQLNPSWDGDTSDELLDAKTILAPSQTITIDIPVAVKELVEDGVAVQSTVNASADNLIDALSAKHTVKVRERQHGGGDQVMVVKSSDAKASVQPGANIMYRIRVSNQTSKIARNLLIRDRAPDHTTLLSSSCGELSPETCKTYLLNDSDIVEDQMTHDALCTTPGRKSAPDGRHVIWCLNGDLEPLDEYVVDYTIQVNGTAPL